MFREFIFSDAVLSEYIGFTLDRRQSRLENGTQIGSAHIARIGMSEGDDVELLHHRNPRAAISTPLSNASSRL